MNYTTLERVKTALGAEATTSDAHLEKIIASVSRAIDRKCTGRSNITDYFALTTIIDEIGQGHCSRDGAILYLARKPLVQAITAFAYRATPFDEWQSIDVSRIVFDGYTVKAWREDRVSGKVFVKMSYSGGLASATDSLPADILDAADVLSVRFFKELKSGLGDTIGVAEFGMMQYTKAFPLRVVEMLKPWSRIL